MLFLEHILMVNLALTNASITLEYDKSRLLRPHDLLSFLQCLIFMFHSKLKPFPQISSVINGLLWLHNCSGFLTGQISSSKMMCPHYPFTFNNVWTVLNPIFVSAIFSDVFSAWNMLVIQPFSNTLTYFPWPYNVSFNMVSLGWEATHCTSWG